MAIEDDVLVVGAGLAGLVAGVAAARAGADVRVVSKADSTLRQASGLVDVLGYTPNGDGPLANPFDAIPELPGSHPYSVVGTAGVRDGLELFDDVTGEAYLGGHTDRNALVPTHGGTVKPTARYPASTAAGLASDGRDALLVGFAAHAEFDAPLAADHLDAAGVPFETDGVTVQFPGEMRDDAKVTRYANALDEDEPLTVEADPLTVGGAESESRLPAREALAEVVRPHLDGTDRVGFPALLGLDHPAEVRADLADALGAAVFELPMGPPSLPGMRLSTLLHEALRDAGATLAEGNPVVDYEPDGDRIQRLLVDRNGADIPYEAEEYVLATGGLVGEGIYADRERVREPVFGCHVPHAEDRYDWFVDEPFGDHSFARFGVTVDDRLRPLDRSGDPEFANLRAAGSVLGGYDFAAENSGSGVSLATGRRAGERAAEAAT